MCYIASAMTPKPPAPWDRQPYDSELSWRAFQTYRDRLPRSRAIVLDGRALNPIEVVAWMRDHFWIERCAEYDRHLDGLRQSEIEAVHAQSARDIAAEHMELAGSARAIAARELAKLREASENSAYESLKPRDLIRLLDLVVKVDRLVRGESTESVDVRDLSSLSDADLEEIERIANRGA